MEVTITLLGHCLSDGENPVQLQGHLRDHEDGVDLEQCQQLFLSVRLVIDVWRSEHVVRPYDQFEVHKEDYVLNHRDSSQLMPPKLSENDSQREESTKDFVREGENASKCNQASKVKVEPQDDKEANVNEAIEPVAGPSLVEEVVQVDDVGSSDSKVVDKHVARDRVVWRIVQDVDEGVFNRHFSVATEHMRQVVGRHFELQHVSVFHENLVPPDGEHDALKESEDGH